MLYDLDASRNVLDLFALVLSDDRHLRVAERAARVGSRGSRTVVLNREIIGVTCNGQIEPD